MFLVTLSCKILTLNLNRKKIRKTGKGFDAEEALKTIKYSSHVNKSP